MMKKGEKIMKTTEKIKLMIRLEKGIKKLDLEELNMISKIVEDKVEDKMKLLSRGKKLHAAVLEREMKHQRKMDSILNAHICEMSEGMMSLSHTGL